MSIKNLITYANLGYNLLKLKMFNQKRPVFLSFFLTNRCNLRCKYCFVVDENLSKEILSAEYSKEEAFKIIDEFYAIGTRMIFLLGGEPLVHNDVGEIIEYIINKGMFLHVITNGTLIEKKLDELKRVHAICVSLDGVGKVNDCLRGERVYERAIAGLEKASKLGINCRIHSVITRHNINKFEELARVAKNLNVLLTVSPPNYLGTGDNDSLSISDEEYRFFWSSFRELKKQGYPIGNSYKSIDIMRNWPIGYHKVMSYTTPLPAGYKRPVRCVNGDIYCGLSAEGILYHCIQLGCLKGPNVKEVGVRKAWEIIVNTRPDCVSCASTNTIENSLFLRLNFETVLNCLRFQIFGR